MENPEDRVEHSASDASDVLTSCTLQEWIEAGQPQAATVVLAGEDDLAPHYAALLPVARINIHFAGFMDGRGFSHAAKLRQLGFAGKLIAGGDVIADQWVYLERCGFDALDGDDKAHSANTLPGFSERYQADAREREPLFKRKR
jgi:uncharacterized protein (DUF934 family)